MPGNFFCPTGSTIVLTVDVTSNRVALGDVANSGRLIRIQNTNAGTPVFVRFGDSTVTAVLATDMSLGSNSTEYFSIPGQATHIACIAGGAASPLRINLGSA